MSSPVRIGSRALLCISPILRRLIARVAGKVTISRSYHCTLPAGQELSRDFSKPSHHLFRCESAKNPTVLERKASHATPVAFKQQQTPGPPRAH